MYTGPHEEIGWRGYAQTDPKIAYKKEGYQLFQEMWENCADEITSLLFRVRPVTREEEESLHGCHLGLEEGAAPGAPGSGAGGPEKRVAARRRRLRGHVPSHS